MRGLGLGLVLWALGASLASAAVVRIDVTGTGNVDILGWYAGNGGSPSRLNLAEISDQIGSTVGLERPLEFIRATTGSVLFVNSAPTNCTGLLVPVCRYANDLRRFGTSRDGFFYSASSIGGGVTVDQRGLLSQDDDIGVVMVSGSPFLRSGTELRATFTTATVSVVPLPASASLVLAGLGALVLRRRGRGRVGLWG